MKQVSKCLFKAERWVHGDIPIILYFHVKKFSVIKKIKLKKQIIVFRTLIL